MKKYILFDFDGTIADTGDGITNSVAYALKKMGLDAGTREERCRFIGPPLKGSFENYHGLTPSEADRAVEFYREYYREKGMFDCFLYDGIEELIDYLNSNGRKVVIASSKPHVFVKRIIDHFGMSDSFALIAGSELDGTRVDKAEVIGYALEKLSISAEDAVMIGDKEHDIIGAKKQGLLNIGVSYGYGSREELENANADYIAASAYELRAIIDRL